MAFRQNNSDRKYPLPEEKVLEVENPTMGKQAERRLYADDDLPALLHLTQEQIDWLVSTGQLTPILIAGEERYDARDINKLIETYKTVQSRRVHSNAKAQSA
jgi:hypothetical protein